MTETALEQVKRLIKELSLDELLMLREHLLEQYECLSDQVDHLRERSNPTPMTRDYHRQDLYGIWRGQVPEDFDLDGALAGIRSEWEKEWPQQVSK